MRNLWEQKTFPLLHRDMTSQQISDKWSLLSQIYPSLAAKWQCWKAKVKWCLLLFWCRSKISNILLLSGQKYAKYRCKNTREWLTLHTPGETQWLHTARFYLKSTNFSVRILPREIKNSNKEQSSNVSLFRNFFQRPHLFPVFQCLFVFLFQVFLLPWGVKHHGCFTHFSDTQVGLLEWEKYCQGGLHAQQSTADKAILVHTIQIRFVILTGQMSKVYSHCTQFCGSTCHWATAMQALISPLMVTISSLSSFQQNTTDI